MTPELNGVMRACAEQIAVGRRACSDEVAVVRDATAAQVAELRDTVATLQAALAEQSRTVATLREQNEALARSQADAPAGVAEQVAGVRRSCADDVAAVRVATGAQLADVQAIAHDLREQTAALRAQAEAVAHTMLAGLRVDGAEIVLRQASGTEFRAALPTPDTAAIAVHVVERHLETLRGDPGEQGEQGERGEQGLRGDRGDVGPVAEPAPVWAPGVYRAGVRRSHAMGRVYEAVTDTAAEPGTSPDWRRLGSTGFAVIGGRDPSEPGDFHLRDGATWLFDGAKSWLVVPKQFTRSDAEALFKSTRASVRDLTSSAAMQSQRLDVVADEARTARSVANEVAQWINDHGDAILRAIRPKAA